MILVAIIRANRQYYFKTHLNENTIIYGAVPVGDGIRSCAEHT